MHLIRCPHGLGDNIYARPLIRAHGRAVVQTPWPELFEDLPVTFAPVTSSLRTQARNIARQSAARWRPADGITNTATLRYGHGDLIGGASICEALESRLPLPPGASFGAFDLPVTAACPIVADRPIAVVRPVTARAEWLNTARNPLPEYVAYVAGQLMATHYVICIADLDSDREWLIGDLPPCHGALLKGELHIRELIALVAHADVVVGGVGWIVPAAVALKRPAFVIMGGQGGHNSPHHLIDSRMDASRLHFAMPKDYCRCTSMIHKCDKTIPDLPEQWDRFRRSLLGAPLPN